MKKILGQRVFIVNNNNGERFDTYVIAGVFLSGNDLWPEKRDP